MMCKEHRQRPVEEVGEEEEEEEEAGGKGADEVRGDFFSLLDLRVFVADIYFLT